MKILGKQEEQIRRLVYLKETLINDPEFHASIKRGLDDIEAGRVIPFDTLMQRWG